MVFGGWVGVPWDEWVADETVVPFSEEGLTQMFQQRQY